MLMVFINYVVGLCVGWPDSVIRSHMSIDGRKEVADDMQLC